MYIYVYANWTLRRCTISYSQIWLRNCRLFSHYAMAAGKERALKQNSWIANRVYEFHLVSFWQFRYICRFSKSNLWYFNRLSESAYFIASHSLRARTELVWFEEYIFSLDFVIFYFSSDLWSFHVRINSCLRGVFGGVAKYKSASENNIEPSTLTIIL